MNTYQHQAVLLEEAVSSLQGFEGDGIYLDATYGRGGHSQRHPVQVSANKGACLPSIKTRRQ